MGIIFGKKKTQSRVTQQDKAVLVSLNYHILEVMFAWFSVLAIETAARQTKTVPKKNNGRTRSRQRASEKAVERREERVSFSTTSPLNFQ